VAGDVLRFTILGCGSSPGTPRITGDWGNCDPANPKNRRTRCAAIPRPPYLKPSLTQETFDE